MEIIVFVKQVPDTESRIVIKDGRVDEEGINFILNPYDEFAVEEGLRLKEKFGGKVIAVTVGPERAFSVLRKVLAMGVDDAILIKDDSGETYDPQRTSKIIAEFLKKENIPFDILFFGKQAIGDDNMGVPAMVAELLGLPQATIVTRLEIEGGKGKAWREIEGASEVVEFELPVVLSAQKGLNEPRYETLKGIMAAKKKEIRTVTLEELGLKELQSTISILKIEPPPPRPAGKILQGTTEEMIKELLNLLRNEAKVI